MSGGYEGSCCLEKSVLRHEEDNIGRALGLSEEEVKKVREFVDSISSRRLRVSQLLEVIWTNECTSLKLEQKIYATFLLGVNLYGSLVRDYLIRAAGVQGGGPENS